MKTLEDMTCAEKKVHGLRKEIGKDMKWSTYDLIIASIDGAWGFDYLTQGKYGWAAFFFGAGALMTLMGRGHYKSAKENINELEALAVRNSERQY